MDDLEEIKRRLDLVEIISQYIQLKKAGRNFKALCPFHTEKTPSFIVSPDKQIWHCFGCSKGGDIFTFLMEYQGIEFGEALRILADKAGVKLKPKDPKLKRQKEELYQINDFAARFFHHILTQTPTGQKPLKYLKTNRGLKDDTISKFQLGYAPDKWDLISRFLKKKGFKDSDIIKSGLVIEKDDGDFYDRFRNRIMFPIFNVAGSPAGFSGRIFDQVKSKTLGKNLEPGKYINSPDSPIYNKSQIIYGLNSAKSAIRDQDQIIIVEGQMDVIACHQTGFENTVASSGTALTLEQINHLKKFSQNLVFAFDPDSAGTQATQRAVSIALQVDLFPKILKNPQGLDPADWLKKSPASFQKSLEKALSVIDFYFQKARKDYPQKTLTPQAKRTIAQKLLPLIKDISNPVAQGDYLQKLANFIKIEEKYLYDALKKTKTTKPQPEEDQIFPQTENASEIVEEKLLGFGLAFPQYLQIILENLEIENLKNPLHRHIAKVLKILYNKDRNIKISEIKKDLADKPQKRIDFLILLAEKEAEGLAETDIEKEIKILLAKIRAENTEEIKKDFQEKIAEAEKSGDRPKIKKLILKLQEALKKEIK